MALTKTTIATNNIQALSDKPNEVEGLTADQLKKKFDDFGIDLKEYINETLTEEIDTVVETKASKTSWESVTATLTYASWDSTVSTGVVNTSSDLSSFIGEGFKIKFTQDGGVKYAICTVPNSGDLVLYLGTDYTLTNTAITDVYYSDKKTPYGFPLNPDKWSVMVKVSGGQTITNPTANQWYSLTNANLTVPIGCWDIYYQVQLYTANATLATLRARSTLSTTTSTETNTDYTKKIEFITTSFGDAAYLLKQTICLDEKTPYYLLIQAQTASYTTLGQDGGAVPLIIKATYAYL